MFDIPDLITAMHGEFLHNQTAKALAGALSGVLEDLRLRFNAAGEIFRSGRIGASFTATIEARSANSERTPEAARAKWKEFIRPLLNAEEMVNPTTGEKIGVDG